MKYSILLLIFGALAPRPLCAQDQERFSKLYDHADFWQLYSAVKELPGQRYVLAGQNTGYWLSNAFLWVHFLDAQGDTLRDVQIYAGDSSVYYPGRQAIVPTSTGSIFSAGGRRYEDDNITKGYLMKLDPHGARVWEKNFGGASFDNFDALAMTAGHELVFAGVTFSLGDTLRGDVYVVKADTTGAVIWEKTIGAFNFYERCYSMDTLADGGFVLSGIQGPGGQKDIFVMKINSEGELVWKKIFGLPNTEDDIFPRIRSLRNGDILLSGALRPSNNIMQAYMARLSPSGDKIWEKYYPYAPSHSVFGFSAELPDGSFVMNGGIIEFDTISNAWWERGTLTKTDKDGELLWQRKYHTRPDFLCYLFGMAPTSDAGFVMCGFGYRPDNLRADAWVVKVDSLGCLEPGCAGGVAAPEPGAAAAWLSVWPNPTAAWLTVESEAPMLGLRLSDLSGRAVEDVQFFRQHGVREHRVSLARLPAEVYVLSVRTDKGWASERVVKE